MFGAENCFAQKSVASLYGQSDNDPESNENPNNPVSRYPVSIEKLTTFNPTRFDRSLEN
jgi:hypothetical protein